MMTPMRYVLLILGLIVSLHYILTLSHEEYARKTSLSQFIPKQHEPPYKVPIPEYYGNGTRRANAAIVILARNGDINGVLDSVKQLEDRFNKKFQYPYVFLNEVTFSEEFKKRSQEIISSTAEYGVIPHEHWFQPDWIDEVKAQKSREKMIEQKVIYGHSVPYRNMCRFNSGFFFKQELLQKYDYYWRVEPNIKFYCDIDYDPFLFMQDNKKVYGTFGF